MLDQRDQMQVTTPVSPFVALDVKAADAPQEPPDFFANYETIHVQKMGFVVHPALAQGYRAACEAYHRMEEETECGPYLFLTGYEYAHLARRHCPEGLTAMEKHNWHCGFIAGWTACVFLIDQ
jgi:hypothetical protein